MQLKKKIVLLGDSAVGKTSLIRRYVFDQFEDSYISTIGTKATMKEMKIPQEDEEIKITLMIWDLLGREGYHALHARSFVGVNGAILVADLTRKETLNSLERYWIPSLFKVVENVPLIFVSNKSDLVKNFEFEPEDMEVVAARYNIGFEEVLPKWLRTDYGTSAKTGVNVEKVFESIGYMMLSQAEQIDPMKELYESLVAQNIKRTLDKSTPIGVLDAIIVDFCEGFEDSRLAMPILRQEIARAGVDVRSPFKEGIRKLIEYLAEAMTEFHDEKTVLFNLKKRLKWVQGISV
ncbi:MAG: GTP-binding protein [Thermoplasmata archaeon]|nr:MAG: GTP-binding protein [Thermoplasmata archaeon]